MNLAMWTAIREYIAAEVRLGIARGLKGVVAYPDGNPIPALEEQSTRMETEVRRLIDATESTSKGHG